MEKWKVEAVVLRQYGKHEGFYQVNQIRLQKPGSPVRYFFDSKAEALAFLEGQ